MSFEIFTSTIVKKKRKKEIFQIKYDVRKIKKKECFQRIKKRNCSPFINDILVNLTAQGISDWSLQYGYLDEKPELVGTVDTGKREE